MIFKCQLKFTILKHLYVQVTIPRFSTFTWVIHASQFKIYYDILNTIPNCHNITIQSMSITIHCDTLVFLNLENKLLTGAK